MELFVDIFLPSLKPSKKEQKQKKMKIRKRKTMQLGEIAPQILKKNSPHKI